MKKLLTFFLISLFYKGFYRTSTTAWISQWRPGREIKIDENDKGRNTGRT